MYCARDALWETQRFCSSQLAQPLGCHGTESEDNCRRSSSGTDGTARFSSIRPCRKRWFGDGAGKAWERDHLPRCEAYIGVEDVSANASRIDENGEAPRYPKVAQDENLEALAVLPGKTEGPIRLISLRASVGGRTSDNIARNPIAAFWDLWEIP